MPRPFPPVQASATEHRRKSRSSSEARHMPDLRTRFDKVLPAVAQSIPSGHRRHVVVGALAGEVGLEAPLPPSLVLPSSVSALARAAADRIKSDVADTHRRATFGTSRLARGTQITLAGPCLAGEIPSWTVATFRQPLGRAVLTGSAFFAVWFCRACFSRRTRCRPA